MFVEKEIKVERVPSRQMGADMLTKHASVGVVRYNKETGGDDVTLYRTITLLGYIG